jgi:DNA-binding CsgD family transcriptional regulator
MVSSDDRGGGVKQREHREQRGSESSGRPAQTRWHLAPPPNLRGWELDVDGTRFVLFEWSAGAQAEPLGLTPAEREVLAHLVRGDSNAAIAEARRTRTRTVANQIAAIFRKLGVHSRAELIARLVRPDSP